MPHRSMISPTFESWQWRLKVEHWSWTYGKVSKQVIAQWRGRSKMGVCAMLEGSRTRFVLSPYISWVPYLCEPMNNGVRRYPISRIEACGLSSWFVVSLWWLFLWPHVHVGHTLDGGAFQSRMKYWTLRFTGPRSQSRHYLIKAPCWSHPK